jgi:hypothetical protein
MTDNKTPVTRTDPITGDELRIDIEEIEKPSHADAEALLAYWHDCRRSGGFAMVRNVPSKTIAHLMKHLVVLEPLPGDFKYRLVGNILIQRLGRDVTGMAISEVFDPAPAQSLNAGAQKVLDTDAPVFQRLSVRTSFGETRRPELVLLPMTSPDAKERLVLVGVFYHDG